jgi:ElaB/YqjD/DUF883 family membrane-anchored ribosome-binding protein
LEAEKVPTTELFAEWRVVVLIDRSALMPTKKTKTQKQTIDTRLVALRSDLNALQADVRSAANDVGEVAGDRANTVMRTAESVAERALGLAEDAAVEWADDIEEWTSGSLDSARESVRTQPLSAILLAMGAGALLGAIFLRR